MNSSMHGPQPPAPTQPVSPRKPTSWIAWLGGCSGALCLTSCLAWSSPVLGVVLGCGSALLAVLVLRGTLLGAPARWRGPVLLGSLALAVWCPAMALLGFVAAEQSAESARITQARAAEAAAAHLAALQQSVPARVEAVRATLSRLPELLESTDVAALDAAAAQLQPLRQLTPPPPELVELDAQLAAAFEQVRRAGAERALARAEGQAARGDWSAAQSALAEGERYLAPLGQEATSLRERGAPIAAQAAVHARRLNAIATATAALDADYADAVEKEEALDGQLEALDAVDAAAREGHERELRDMRRRVERARRSNHASAERLRRERIMHLARLALCGDAPTVGGWDGELLGAEHFIARSAHDPDSIDVENCTTPALAVNRNHCWLSTCDVLGRNAFGAMIRNRMQFEVSHDRIIGAR